MTLRDIADTLTRAGIATLRADDRGVGGSTGSQQTYTTFAKVADIRRLVNWLRSQPSVDHVGIAGYSEGGLVAIMAAAADSKIAAIATLAAPGVSGEQVARYQITLGVDNDPTIPKADRAKAITQQLAEPLTAHERSYLSIEPLRYARAVRCPALIMQGSTDFNVPTRSSERLAEAMREAGNTDVSVMLYPDVSHSFLPDTFGLPADWPYLPGFLTTPGALDELTRWFAQRLLVSP